MTATPLPDPKLLLLFDELFRTRSVTKAAANLGQEQPTISVWLTKLRKRFGDALFVRTTTGMQPTPYAEALLERVREALESLRRIEGGVPVFDPASAERQFRVCMTDASQVTLLPRLLAHVHTAAPHVHIDVDYMSEDVGTVLEAGSVDLAIGFLPTLAAGFYQQSLFMQDFVCLVVADHPRVRKALSLRQYEHEAHIGLSLSGTGHGIVDEAMARQRIRRRVLLRLPGFLGLAKIVSTTDLIATLPRGIGQALAEHEAIRLLDCPVKIPAYTVKQHWHARYHNDPANRWLRNACAALFTERTRR